MDFKRIHDFGRAFGGPRFVSLNQRIAVRIALQAFDMSETQEYVDSQIRAAKGEPQIFSEQGCRKIYHLTDGIPG